MAAGLLALILLLGGLAALAAPGADASPAPQLLPLRLAGISAAPLQLAGPSVPTTFSPKGTLTTRTPRFSWSRVDGAVGYDVRVYRDGTLLEHKNDLKATSWRMRTPLPKNVRLTWRVRARGAGGAGAWSVSRHFRIVNPRRPKGTITTTTPTFSWGRRLGATSYQLRVYRAGKLLLRQNDIRGLHYKAPKALPTHARLLWRVRGSGAHGRGAWSTLLAFRIVPPSSAKALTAFSFQGLAPAVVGTIDESAHSIALTVPAGTDLTHLVASFATSGAAVTVAGTKQVSGVSVNDFSRPLTYTVRAADGTSQDYLVSVSLASDSVAKFAVTLSGGMNTLAGSHETAGTPLQVRVAAEDAAGNLVPGFAGTVELTSNAFSGRVSATITGGGYVDAVVLTPTVAGADRTIAAAAGAVTTSDASGDFDVSAAVATQLQVSTPGAAVAGAPFALTVTAKDSYGNTVTGFAGPATLSVSDDDTTLSPTSLAFTDGVASPGVTLTKAGSGIALTAKDGALSGASGPFAVEPGPMAGFAVDLAPDQVSGVAFAGTDTVTAQDAYGNTVTSYDAAVDNVTISASPNDGTVSGLGTVGSAVLDRTFDFANGVADLSGSLVFSGAAGSHTFTATAAVGGYSGTSGSVTIAAGSASAAVLTSQPSGAADGAALTGAPVVQLQDAAGNDVAAAGVDVVATLASGSGTLSGTTTVATDAGGTATFANLIITGTTGSYTLTFTSTGLAGVTSNSFTLAPGAASQLAITTEPVGGASGALLTVEPVVQVQDAQGNLVTSSSATVSVTSSTGGTLGGSEAGGLAASAGVATFTDLTLAGTVGDTYTLTFHAGGLTAAVSQNVSVSVGAADAAQSTLTPTSANLTADGASTQVLTVHALDSAGNALTSGGDTVTITKLSGTGTIGSVTDNGDGSYAATITAPTTTGSGTFVATLDGDAVEGGGASQTQATVSYLAGPATQIALNAGDGQSATVGTAVATAPSVIVEDANGNPVSGASVTFAVASGGGSATGVSAITNAAGIATVGSWTLGTTAGSNTLTATSTGLSGSPVTFTATGTPPPGEYIAAGGSGGGGGGDYDFDYGYTMTGGDGASGSGTITGTAENDVIFGSGSGGGGGGSQFRSGTGGAAGAGNVTINGGAGDDIIFGAGFNGISSAVGGTGAPGGFGGGGGGGSGAYGTYAGSGGLLAGGGGAYDGAGSSYVGASQYGGSAGGASPPSGYSGNAYQFGGNAATTSGGYTALGGSGCNAYGGAGGAGFDGANTLYRAINISPLTFMYLNGGEPQYGPSAQPGQSGLVSWADASGGLYSYVHSVLAQIAAGTQPGTQAGIGAGSCTINGGPGDNDLFGTSGTTTFDFELDDASASGNTNTVWNFTAGSGDKLDLSVGGTLITAATCADLVGSQTANGTSRTIVFSDASHIDTIVIYNLGRDLTTSDFDTSG